MVLGALGRPVPPIHEIRRGVQAAGGYVEAPEGIRGLIYAGAVTWLAGQGIPARILLDQSAQDVAQLVEGQASLFIASVHPGIRRPETSPTARGGHLVLVFGRDAAGALRLHNPSGDSPGTQADARIPIVRFQDFFAGRGILVG
ncbi:hypothetical protein ACLF3G_13915 [Falsiroseomonas sp. HC035]|uniref:hypothetical protein n=1 Tax=Falsiroseomonas sp. HC035 TaxID=3390999 RepID=UPI003D320122